MKRFITYLDDLAKRTYFGTDGTLKVVQNRHDTQVKMTF